MNYIFEALRNGDHSIVDTFVKANALWLDILTNIERISIEELAKRLGSAQDKFERVAQDRDLGKLLCGLSGFTHLYSCQVGFEDNIHKARKLGDAFAKSSCSLEVKGAARRAAELYGLED